MKNTKGFIFLMIALVAVGSSYVLFNLYHTSSTTTVKAKHKDKPGEMLDYLFEKQKNPITNSIPIESQLKAFNEVKKRAQNLKKDGLKNIFWVERGPNNVGGRTRALMYDPNDPTQKKVWAGSMSGGMWFNNDIQNPDSSWYNVDDFMSSLAISCLTYDPTNPKTFYAGTGEGYYNGSSTQGLGIFKSVDGGNTWNHIVSTIPSDNNNTSKAFYYTNDIVVTKNGTILATTRGKFANYGGVMRSVDGGISWSNTTPSELQWKNGADLEIAANGDIYVSFGLKTEGSIYRSSDDGLSWINVSPPENGKKPERIEIAIAPSASSTTNTTVLYAVAQNAGDNNVAYLQKSINGGLSWISLSIPKYREQNCAISNTNDFSRQQAWFNLIIQVSPIDENFLLLGGIDLLKSTNGGASWEQFSMWFDNSCFLPYVHADQHQILFNKQRPNEVIFGNDGGVYYNDAIYTDAKSIESRIKNYNTTQFYAADIAKSFGSNQMLAGAQDNGTQQFTTTGVNATTEITGGDGGFCFFDPYNDENFITSYVYNNWHFFTNGILTNESYNNSGRFINPAAYDGDSQILYTAGNSNEYYTYNFDGNGQSFKLDLNSEIISAISTSPFSENTIFVATSYGSVFKIMDADINPYANPINTPILPNAYISCIALGSTEDEMVITYSSYGVKHVFYTHDGGINWVNKTDNLPDMPINWALFDPKNSNNLLLATEYGVWSTDSLLSSTPNWELTSTGLANVRCEMIRYRENDSQAVVATFGRGVYTGKVFSPPPLPGVSDWVSPTASGEWHDRINWDRRIPTTDDDIRLDHLVVSSKYSINVNSNAAVNNLHFVDENISLVLEENVSLSYANITGKGNIILKSGASIVPKLGSKGGVEGDFTVIRERPDNQDSESFNFWSSPMIHGNISMLEDVQDVIAFKTGSSNQPSDYVRNFGTLQIGKGYAANKVTRANFKGLVNTGLLLTSIQNNSAFGGGAFNLIGNPYPSALNAEQFVTDNAELLQDASVYIWNRNETNGLNYNSISPSNFSVINYAGHSSYDEEINFSEFNIASCQGFGVYALQNGKVEFNNSQRNRSNTNFKSIKELLNAERAWFTISQESIEQSILITFGEQATDAIDYHYDAHAVENKLELQMASIQNNEMFLINAWPTTTQEVTIPLSVTVPNVGEFNIELKKSDNLNSIREVYLRDNYTDEQYNLLDNSIITFSSNGTNVWKDRFELIFRNSDVGVTDGYQKSKLIINSPLSNTLQMHSLYKHTGNIKVYSSYGQLVKEFKINPLDVYTNTLSSGVYIIEFTHKDYFNRQTILVQ